MSRECVVERVPYTSGWWCSIHKRDAEKCDFIIQEESQCGRCGSSMSWEDCHQCGGEGTYECGDPIQCCDGYHPCTWCQGSGGWPLCISSAEWCLANPRPGHEETPRHTEETFTYPEPASMRSHDDRSDQI